MGVGFRIDGLGLNKAYSLDPETTFIRMFGFKGGGRTSRRGLPSPEP